MFKKFTALQLRNMTHDQIAEKLAARAIPVSPALIKKMREDRRVNFERWLNGLDN